MPKSCRCGSMAEQRIRNAQVSGSTPLIGSTSSGSPEGVFLLVQLFMTLC